jgi:cellulose biosynthesis protein BcsQ
MADPYVLAFASHKGGTGRTTAALALAWLWGQAGHRVTLADADPAHAAGLVARGPGGECDWLNVRYLDRLPAAGEADGDVVIVDCPRLLEPEVAPVLARADGIVLACLADPLTLRLVPAAVGVLAGAKAINPRGELLGLTIGLYNESDTVQPAMLARLRQVHADVFIEPPVPFDPALHDWPLAPGAGLPPGRGADAFAALARALEALMRNS